MVRIMAKSSTFSCGYPAVTGQFVEKNIVLHFNFLRKNQSEIRKKTRQNSFD